MVLDLDGFPRVDQFLQLDLICFGEVFRLTLFEQALDFCVHRVQLCNVGGQLVGNGSVASLIGGLLKRR